MQKFILKMICPVLVLFVIVIGCQPDKVAPPPGPQPGPAPDPCATISAKFSTDVSVIIQTSCAINGGACHGAGSVNGPGPLTNFSQIKASASGIRSAVVSKRMPLGATLSQAQIDKIKCWVDNGALEN